MQRDLEKNAVCSSLADEIRLSCTLVEKKSLAQKERTKVENASTGQ